jgi:hypothetical protein
MQSFFIKKTTKKFNKKERSFYLFIINIDVGLKKTFEFKISIRNFGSLIKLMISLFLYVI